MPRASASAKRQQQQGSAASNSQHPNSNNRHDNGLVGPGKRLPKNLKSQGYLNATANSRHSAASSSENVSDVLRGGCPASPPTIANTATTPASLASSVATPADPDLDDMANDAARRGSVSAFSETSSSESYSMTQAIENHRRIDVNATKNTNVHRDPGPLEFIFTVLRSYPPIALSGIYVLFTLLTFVTTSSGLSLSEVFEWNLGAPSIATVVCVDGIVLLIWLFLWGPIQHVILDLAQMVIALGLGGGSRERDGGSMKNSLVCLSMILLSHVLRHTKMKYSPIGYLLGSSRFMTPDIDDPLESLDSIRGYDRVQSGWVNWVRSVLAIHILTQGLVKYIRDWYLRRERRDNDAQSVDPEACKPSAGDFSNDGGFSTPDSDAAALQPQATINTKKKRKQSAQIRNRQPLWAAIASTKIVVVKEYELTHSAADSADANATGIHNLGNAPFVSEADQIWISFVGCDEISFNTSHFPAHSGAAGGAGGTSSHEIDLTKPFYVRVNNAIWQPTRIEPDRQTETSDNRHRGVTWSGDIYGLTAMSNYECEFVSTTTHEILLSTSLRTTQAKTAGVDQPNLKPSNQRSLCPDSPITTLRTSIAGAEAKYADEKNRQKSTRKEWSRKMNALKKELEKLSSAVQSAGTGDDKMRQKIQQNQTQTKQAQHAISLLETELKEYDALPESLLSAWKTKQSSYNVERASYDKAVAELKGFKTLLDSQVKSMVDEKSNLEGKRNKISSRIAKVDGELSRLADANARGLNEAERRRQDRANLEANLAKAEQEQHERLNLLNSRNAHQDQVVASLKSDIEALQNQQQQAALYSGAVDYSEPMAAGQMPHGAAVNSAPYDPNTAWNQSAYNMSLWGPSALASGFVPQSSPSSRPRHMMQSRGRSSSMLSDVSGFTQSSSNDDDVAEGSLPGSTREPLRPPPGFGFPGQRKGEGEGEIASTGSGSASASGSAPSSGSASVGDPSSPGPARRV
ncbi:ubiquitination network signaling protein acrB [Apiospora kogelbergensis]|uniref:Ubiquitination network signaling protein acrB n=1 Tax=Apiospora kogelbergensis TaxID=1337665 RepID=A0AAW0Q8E2_9PEZI